jgi:peptide methionine sulfoxide reductase MsrB
VGNLEPLRNAEIEIHGTVREYHRRAEIVLNDRQQLHGGKERFRPNPALSKFDSSTGHVAFKDPSATQVVHVSGAFSHHMSRGSSSKANAPK